MLPAMLNTTKISDFVGRGKGAAQGGEWDWSRVPDRGVRFENMVAGHLLKY